MGKKRRESKWGERSKEWREKREGTEKIRKKQCVSREERERGHTCTQQRGREKGIKRGNEEIAG